MSRKFVVHHAELTDTLVNPKVGVLDVVNCEPHYALVRWRAHQSFSPSGPNFFFPTMSLLREQQAKRWEERREP
jgi:hypothetical protein